mmetsp:Transcript_13141/g.30238  ORF Transcript_13141/g.30238 Transcript_13141/m.30238 type:complete len:89 (-) Transcript_13141:536-802(-)
MMISHQMYAVCPYMHRFISKWWKYLTRADNAVAAGQYLQDHISLQKLLQELAVTQLLGTFAIDTHKNATCWQRVLNMLKANLFYRIGI